MDNLGMYVMGSSIALLILLTVIALIYFVISSRNVKRQKKYYEEIHTTMARGQRVVLASGIYGKLVRVGEETCDVEVKSGAVLEVSRASIRQIVGKTKELDL